MNDFYNLVAHRASCRAYRPEPIPEEVFRRVLEAGCKAPSAGGFQNYSIIRVKDPEVRKALTKVCRGQQFITAAPECLVLCVDYHRMDQTREIEPAPFQETDQFENFVMGIADVMIAAQTMVLAAESEHLGSCYIGNVLNAMDRVTELLRLPERVFPVILLTFGWPKSPRKQPPKYSPDLLVHEDYYQERTPSRYMPPIGSITVGRNLQPARNNWKNAAPRRNCSTERSMPNGCGRTLSKKAGWVPINIGWAATISISSCRIT